MNCRRSPAPGGGATSPRDARGRRRPRPCSATSPRAGWSPWPFPPSRSDRSSRAAHSTPRSCGAAGASWIAVTSANGATAVLDAARRLGRDLSGRRWAAVGPATSAALAARGVRVAFMPTTADAATLAAELPIGPGDEVLLPLSDLADTGPRLRPRGSWRRGRGRGRVSRPKKGPRSRASGSARCSPPATSGRSSSRAARPSGACSRCSARPTAGWPGGPSPPASASPPHPSHGLPASSTCWLPRPRTPSALADLVAAAVLLPIPDPAAEAAAEPRQEVPS